LNRGGQKQELPFNIFETIFISAHTRPHTGTGQLTLEARRVREHGTESESQQAGEGAAGLTGFAGLQPWAAAVQGRALVCC
jgi:hypothetical protein